MKFKGKGKMICGCGTCGDVVDAALRLTRSDMDACATWWLAVSRVVQQIALQRVLMQMVSLEEKRGSDILDPKVIDMLRKKAGSFGGKANSDFDKAIDEVFYLDNTGPFILDACEGFTKLMPSATTQERFGNHIHQETLKAYQEYRASQSDDELRELAEALGIALDAVQVVSLEDLVDDTEGAKPH